MYKTLITNSTIIITIKITFITRTSCLINSGYLQGLNTNNSTVITKISGKPNEVINDICVIANTQNVSLLSGQFTLSSIHKSVRFLTLQF